MNDWHAIQKRCFDLFLAITAICLVFWIIALAWFVASLNTKGNGLFVQDRIGLYGKRFRIFKIRTMYHADGLQNSVTTKNEPRITKSGRFFRRFKIDELPQLFNIIIGDMSFVGPRPDVPGFADELSGEDRIILSIRPGITSPASLKYHDEEDILAQQEDPIKYNRSVIWPDKVRMNVLYIKQWSMLGDIRLIVRTIFRDPNAKK